eukprot:8951322-Lingulodinium_polyedra.AAC.1
MSSYLSSRVMAPKTPKRKLLNDFDMAISRLSLDAKGIRRPPRNGQGTSHLTRDIWFRRRRHPWDTTPMAPRTASRNGPSLNPNLANATAERDL